MYNLFKKNGGKALKNKDYLNEVFWNLLVVNEIKLKE